VRSPFVLNSDSTLSVPTAPGTGAEVDEAFLDSVTLEKVDLTR